MLKATSKNRRVQKLNFLIFQTTRSGTRLLWIVYFYHQTRVWFRISRERGFLITADFLATSSIIYTISYPYKLILNTPLVARSTQPPLP